MPLTQVQSGMMDSVAQYNGFKNRLINGAMVIDQRNNGASVSVALSTYGVDRFMSAEDTDGTLSVQQVSDAPTGFTKSIRFTVGTADSSLTSTQYAYFRQAIEGYNFADLAFGTTSAATVTVSFWVKSSVAGLYSGKLASSNHDRCNAFSFTINAANTWEQKTVTITGDLTGTWLTTNGVGAYLHFCLCSGSTYLQSSTGVWQAGTFLGATGTTNLMATAGATFLVTGVQLEKGSTATSFDYRPYTTELQLCQRYLPMMFVNPVFGLTGQCYTSQNVLVSYPFKVTPRVAPTGIIVSSASGGSLSTSTANQVATNSIAFYNGGVDYCSLVLSVATTPFTAGHATLFAPSSTTIQFTGCEL